jgi:phytanoyl-CoA hydroxylase
LNGGLEEAYWEVSICAAGTKENAKMTDLPLGLTRHPWSTEFTWEDTTGPFRRISDAEAEAYNRDGFFILRGVFSSSEIDRVRQATDELERETDSALASTGGRQGISEKGAITFSSHLVTKSVVLRDFARHHIFGELCADLVGPDVNLYWDQAVYKKPEKPRRFPWHQDNGYTFVVPQQYLTCWTPLVEATLDNGCPQVVPGLHRFGTLQHNYVDPLGWECFPEPPSPAVQAPVSPGDVAVFSSLSPHLTGPNLTSDVRKAYILQYAPVGAVVLVGTPLSGPHVGRAPCGDPDLNFAVARSGRPADEMPRG